MNLLPRLQRGLTAYARHVLPEATVLWGHGEYPEAAAASVLVAARIVSGPRADARGAENAAVRPMPTTARVRFDAGPGPIVLAISGMRWVYDAPAGATAEQTRDALAAQIGTDPPLAASVAVEGGDALRLEGPPGSLYPLQAQGRAAVEVEAASLATVTVSDEVARVEFQAFAASTSLRRSAATATQALRAARRRGSARRVLAAHGLSIVGDPGHVVDLPHMAGPAWASRSALSMAVAAVAVTADPVDTIDALSLHLTARGPTTDHVATVVAPS